MQVSQKEAVQVPFQLTEAQTSQEVALALPRPQEEVVTVLLQRETRQGAREGAAEERPAPHTIQDSQRQVDVFRMVPVHHPRRAQYEIIYFFFSFCRLLSCSVQHDSVGGTSGQKSHAARPHQLIRRVWPDRVDQRESAAPFSVPRRPNLVSPISDQWQYLVV